MDIKTEAPELLPFLDEELRLPAIPTKHKKMLSAIYYLATKIEPEKEYSEQDINLIINKWTVFRDPATLRIEMYNNYLIDRKQDCSCYRRKRELPTLAEFIAKNT